ncbi:Phosphopantothenoylcysteine decarboxylase / Phosphopantothenoylcysteine synthetase [hydrothermal vent metagenome]|uniref:Phosphopantothenoylcysteine decarboxylase / Phosphopantothenoylcysteine synthetase n=1 Tax=hydrothermal vent metagenome TaxID=652676 RepID=A0A3B1D3P8_9ZZZZ
MEEHRKIVLGVTGSIAAYKSADIIRQLQKKGFKVSTVMTKNAECFITPLTLSTLCNEKVYRETKHSLSMPHIDLMKGAQGFLIAPATANIIGKMANGIADDILSSVVLVAKCPIILAPAMNTAMYQNSIVQENVAKLKTHGIHFIDPVEGDLACGITGEGHIAPVEKIVDCVENYINSHTA